jgi:hypothetical protein
MFKVVKEYPNGIRRVIEEDIMTEDEAEEVIQNHDENEEKGEYKIINQMDI